MTTGHAGEAALQDREQEAAQISVAIAAPKDREAWDAFVASRDDAVAYHEWAWGQVIERTFGHDLQYLMARRDGRVAGVLPLILIRSALFGRSLTSLPFVNYGGVLADSDAVRQSLLDRALAAAVEHRCAHVELRHVAQQFPALPCRRHKVTMWLRLEPKLWERLDRKVRNQIRKAEKSELTVQDGGEELLDDFYAVFARNMRDLGTPVYAKRFFVEIMKAFPGRARLFVVRRHGMPIAAGLAYRTRGTIEVPWASSVREYSAYCPNHLLYWRAIESAVAHGCTTFDFGRSTPGGGTYRFKEQWGAQPVPLHWEYGGLPPGTQIPDTSPSNPKFRLAISLWKSLPLSVANRVGPHIVRAIP